MMAVTYEQEACQVIVVGCVINEQITSGVISAVIGHYGIIMNAWHYSTIRALPWRSMAWQYSIAFC